MSAAVPPTSLKTSLTHAVAELERRHSLGALDVCESVLADFPELCAQRDAVLELIYLEYVLCQEANRAISPAELQARFPEYQSDLQKILSVDRVFRKQADTPDPSETTIGSNPKHGQSDRHKRGIHFDHLGDYELLEIIGHGGMGVVYRARQRKLNRLVAVKTIDMLASLNPAAVARFHNEAELVAKLQHPNIVQVYEVGSKLGVPFFSMELISGGTLAQATQERPLVPAVAAKIVETLARAVHYAHTQSVVHRDLKPANILLSPSDRDQAIEVPSVTHLAPQESKPSTIRCEPKIADFGLAKFLEGAIDRTATQGVIGTPSYMAPEQIDPDLGSVGPACDIYSLGAILYHAMTGTPPFNAATVIETIQQVRTSDVIAPSRLQSKIPRDLETIVLKCLRKEPANRYTTADELADDLHRFLAGQPILARPAGLLERNWKWARRHPSLTAFIAAVVAASIGMTFLWLKSENSRIGEQDALQRNERLLYDRDIGLAKLEYESNRIERSREILEKTRPEYRGWEWHYLNLQNNRAIWESPKLRDPVVEADIRFDGKYVAAVSNDPNEHQPEPIHVWDIEKNELRWKLEGYSNSAAMKDVRFSPDGALLLTAAISTSGGAKAGVKLWDLNKGTIHREVSDVSANVCRFSRDGKTIFAGKIDGYVTEFSTESGDKVRDYPCKTSGSNHSIVDLDFNREGSRMVVATLESDVTLWDTLTGNKLQTLSKVGAIRKVAWSPDGSSLSLSLLSGPRRLYQFEGDKLTPSGEKWGSQFDHGELTPDGRRFVSAQIGKSIEIEDVATGRIDRVIPAHNGNTRTVSFDALGRYMLTGGSDNRLRVFDLAVNDPKHSEESKGVGQVNDIVVSPTSREIALAYHSTRGKPIIELRDARSLQIVSKLEGHTKSPTCVAYSTDEIQLLSGGEDATVRVWSPKKRLLKESEDGRDRSWWPMARESLAVLEGHDQPIAGVSFLSDERFATSVDKDGKVIVWNLENRSIERSWQLEGAVQSVSFHPLRPLIAVACEGYGVSIWELEGKKLLSLPVTGEFHLVCFSPDGKRLATVADRATTMIWRTDEGSMRRKKPTLITELAKHSNSINNISFSPDGKRLVLSSREARLWLSDVESGNELLTLESMRDSGGLVQFSPDGKTIVRTLSGNIRTWSIDEINASQARALANQVGAKWHFNEFGGSIDSRNYFAAELHLNALVELEPEKFKHFRWRSIVRSQLCDFAGAEADLHHCDGKLESDSGQRELLGDLAKVYLCQDKWIEFQEHCDRLLTTYYESSSVTSLDVCLRFWLLGNRQCNEATEARLKFESLMEDSQNRNSTDKLETLALHYYRDRGFKKAIDTAEEAKVLWLKSIQN